MTHNLVIDTNVLLSDGSALKKFGKETLNIPFVVLQELDKHKTSPGNVGVNARSTIRFLDSLRVLGDLREGVLTSEGTLIRVFLKQDGTVLSPDDQIIQAAVQIAGKVKLISNDINLRVKASMFGIEAEGHNGNAVQVDDDEFTGILEEKVPGSLIDQLHATGEVGVGSVSDCYSNQYVHFVNEENEKHTGIGRVVGQESIRIIKSAKNIYGLTPKSLEQVCALDALLNTNIPLVTLTGPAGSGKTICALAAALELVLQRRDYDRIVIMRPPIPMGKDIGFLPGDMYEKYLAWMGPIYDSFEALMSSKGGGFEYLIDTGQIDILPPSFVRGRNLANTILLVDEFQNLNAHEAKTIVTRIHSSSKLILTGDVRQIDDPRLSAADNGLSHIIDAFKPYEEAAHIALTKCERGSLAALAAEIL